VELDIANSSNRRGFTFTSQRGLKAPFGGNFGAWNKSLCLAIGISSRSSHDGIVGGIYPRLRESTGKAIVRRIPILSRMPIAASLILPFTIILLLTTLLLIGVGVWFMSNFLHEALEERAQMVTRNLASELSDPLTMGQADRVESEIKAVCNSDKDLKRVVVTSFQGRVIASTNPSDLRTSIYPSLAEKQLFKHRQRLSRQTLGDDSFQLTTPIIMEYEPGWIVRTTFSAQRADTCKDQAICCMLLIGAAGLIFSISTYVGLIRKSILDPIRNIVEMATKISEGDLGDKVDVYRNDEIGLMINAMNNMVGNLKEMARTANAISKGDLHIKVEPRSERDVFGIAFKDMMISLNEHTSELAAREERFRSLCQTSPVGIFETNAAGCITFANACLQAITEKEAHELIGKPWYQFVHVEDTVRALNLWNEIGTEHHDPYLPMEFRIVRASGEQCWVRCLATPLQTNKEEHGFVATIEDITRRKEQEENAQRLALLEQREEFMATLSHDLKNPLIGANRVLQLIAQHQLGPISDKHVDLLEKVHESNRRLLSLIQNLIDSFRYEKDINSVLPESTDASKLLTSCVEDVAALAKNRAITVKLDLPEEAPMPVLDPNGIRRVLQNLIDNSLKFTPQGGAISVGVRQQCDSVVFQVADTGSGIPKEEQKNLFKRFSQGKAGRKYSPGSGLGLYLCKQIIEAHNGTIRCKSQVGRGTLFEVELPTPQALTQPSHKTMQFAQL
jgi:PAS domain S-box-containing protein